MLAGSCNAKELVCAAAMRTYVLFLIFLFYSPAGAAEVHGALTLTSDYVSRGYSKSAGGFALQANLDYEHSSGIYFGVSSSTVDFDDPGFPERAQFEVTPYLGWSTLLTEDWRLDMQWSRYFYDGKIFGEFSDYNEFYWILNYRDLVTGRASFSEDFYHRGHASGDFEISGRYPVNEWLEISGGIGYSLTKQAIEYDYLYWNSGFNLFFKNLVFGFRYMDALQADTLQPDPTVHAQEQFPGTIDATFVFFLTIGF